MIVPTMKSLYTASSASMRTETTNPTRTTATPYLKGQRLSSVNTIKVDYEVFAETNRTVKAPLSFVLSVLLFVFTLQQQHQQHQFNWKCESFSISSTTTTTATTKLQPTRPSSLLQIHNHHNRPAITTTLRQSVNGEYVNGSSSHQNSSSKKKKNGKQQQQVEKVPFVIERVPNYVNPSSTKMYQEIAHMCITAFFNNDNNNSNNNSKDPSRRNQNRDNIPFYKEWQLRYLRTLQAGDLERRRKREPIKNRMFIARRVLPYSNSNNNNGSKTTTTNSRIQQRPLVLDTSTIRNLPTTSSSSNTRNNNDDVEYMLDDIIGFVEVTQRPYGLGETGYMVERFVLTNLSVDDTVRNSSIGSALVAVCEGTVYQEYVQEQKKINLNGNSNTSPISSTNGDDGTNNKINGLKWNLDTTDNRKERNLNTNTALIVIPDMVLEVEEDNINAIDFYRKRGYVDVCVDPTSRRYDTSGLWLQQVRCKRLVMTKDLRRTTPFQYNNSNDNDNNIVISTMENTVSMGLQAFQRFRNKLMNVQ
jgi:ribosomal protein S18 acetylase RimI-like enzyme